jgi:subtilisin family serine protease
VRDCWRVAILDSGLADPAAAPDSGQAPIASCRFVDSGREVVRAPVTHDTTGHGTEVCRVICSAERSVELLIGQVLDPQGLATAAAIAAAILWALEEGADLIHMSLGLRADRSVLAGAVDSAIKEGCIVVASAPARGEVTFPARYPEVIRATGDARCGRDQISVLNSVQADFGGCPRYVRKRVASATELGGFGGASIGAAHVTRLLVGRVARGAGVAGVRSELGGMASYRGVEHCLCN